MSMSERPVIAREHRSFSLGKIYPSKINYCPLKKENLFFLVSHSQFSHLIPKLSSDWRFGL